MMAWHARARQEGQSSGFHHAHLASDIDLRSCLAAIVSLRFDETAKTGSYFRSEFNGTLVLRLRTCSHNQLRKTRAPHKPDSAGSLQFEESFQGAWAF